MACHLHRPTKFCLFCIVITAAFHVHLCHKYGDLSHEDRHVNNTNPGLQAENGTQLTGDVSITPQHSHDLNQFSPNEGARPSDGPAGDGLVTGVHNAYFPEPYNSSAAGNNTENVAVKSPDDDSRSGDGDLIHDNLEGDSSQPAPDAKNSTNDHGKVKKHRHRQFLWSIFNKYGEDGVMTYEDLERLMEHLGLGPMEGNISAESASSQPEEGSGRPRVKRSHESLSPAELEESKSNQMSGRNEVHLHVKRDTTGADRANLRHQKKKDWEEPLDKCLDTSDVMVKSRISPSDLITPDVFLKLCPILIQQLDSRACGQPKLDQHQDAAVPRCPSCNASVPCNNTDSNGEGYPSSIEHRHGSLGDEHDSHDHEDGDHEHDHGHDHEHDHEYDDDQEHAHGVPEVTAQKNNSTSQSILHSETFKVWGCSITACLIISVVGLFCVAIVPCMQKVVYNHVLQFLVAMAIGSLAGDALLHLIPHALVDHAHGGGSARDVHEHDHNDSHEHHEETQGHDLRHVWLGLVSLMGIYLFFIIERLVGLLTGFKRKNSRKRNKKQGSPLLMRRLSLTEAGAKGSGANESRTCEDNMIVVHTNKEVAKMAEDSHQEVHKDCDQQAQEEWGGAGHSHGHNHSHTVPSSVAAVAWMVIVGDGLHNFSDGLAIGASFASSLSGGLSTSVAVFCHELPHELGDFAVLIRAGMSVKNALLYNVLSSVLCFLGMLIGVSIGNLESADQWVFAAIAGMFIYIALVDMLPELTKVGPKEGENPCCHLLLQIAGMSVGAGIMLLIAIFEDDIVFPAF